MYKWSINRVINPNPVYSHSYRWQYEDVNILTLLLRLRRKYSPRVDLWTWNTARGEHKFWRALRLEAPALYVQSGFRRPQPSGDRWNRRRMTTSGACAPRSDKCVSAGTLLRARVRVNAVRFACELSVTAPEPSWGYVRDQHWFCVTCAPETPKMAKWHKWNNVPIRINGNAYDLPQKYLAVVYIDCLP
jgi:hypothetical protein